MHELRIEGMTCGHCRKAVEDALASVEGVERVDVDLERGHAHVEGGNVDRLVEAVREEGYRASPAR